MTMQNCCLTLLSRTTYNILLRKGNKLQLTALQCVQSDPLRKTSNKKSHNSLRGMVSLSGSVDFPK